MMEMKLSLSTTSVIIPLLIAHERWHIPQLLKSAATNKRTYQGGMFCLLFKGISNVLVKLLPQLVFVFENPWMQNKYMS